MSQRRFFLALRCVIWEKNGMDKVKLPFTRSNATKFVIFFSRGVLEPLWKMGFTQKLSHL